ncbi:MAG: hypothetical protein AAF501_12655 [Pseudomonadota bacterium]
MSRSWLCGAGGAWAPRIKAVGAVVGYYRDVEAMRAADLEGFQTKVDQGISAREHYEATGEAITIPAAALEGDAAMTLESTYDYYATPRAGVANYTNALAVMSREHFLTFDVQSDAALLDRPFAMVHSEGALSPSSARKFYEGVTAEKVEHWIDGPNQTAFYDDPYLVDRAADFVAEHLMSTLFRPDLRR